MAAFRLAATLWQLALLRARVLRSDEHRTLGASAIEWAVISAIVVTAAVVIGGIIYNVIEDKGSAIEDCANQPVGSPGC